MESNENPRNPNTEGVEADGIDRLAADLGCARTDADKLLGEIRDAEQVINSHVAEPFRSILADAMAHNATPEDHAAGRRPLDFTADEDVEFCSLHALVANGPMRQFVRRLIARRILAATGRADTFTDNGDATPGTLPLVKFGPGGDFTREVRP